MEGNDAPLNEPELGHMPPQKMAAVYARGRPEQAIPGVLPALYNALFTLKFERSVISGTQVPVRGLRVRYSEADGAPSPQWTIVIGLPVPETITVLPQTVGGVEIRLETWEYGDIAQLRHDGSIIDGLTPHERLMRFITDNEYRITGVREEVFTPEPSDPPQSIIRYRVVRR